MVYAVQIQLAHFFIVYASITVGILIKIYACLVLLVRYLIRLLSVATYFCESFDMTFFCQKGYSRNKTMVNLARNPLNLFGFRLQKRPLTKDLSHVEDICT